MFRWRIIGPAIFLFLAILACAAQKKSDKSFTVVYKDGHQKSFSLSDSSRIEFKGPNVLVSHDGRQDSIPLSDVARIDFNSGASKTLPVSMNRFVGKWEFGMGPGQGTFSVTLDRDGQAHKSIGSAHGTWVLVDNEARISWDDGWHDVIRKVGGKLQKFAYEPGRSITDDPSNVSTAESLNGETM